jgi:uncharacterized membrane protein
MRYFEDNKNSSQLVLVILLVSVITFSIYFSIYQIQRYKTFSTGLDTTSMEQPLWNTLHGRFMRATYYPVSGLTVDDFTDRKTEIKWGDHVQPIQLALLIPYALNPRTETLMVLLSVSVALGAIPLFRIARRRFSSPWVALLFALGYLLLPGVQANSAWDIHGTNFLPPLLLASFDAMESGKVRWWWFWALLAMGCREDIPFLAGWAMICMAPKERRKGALALFGVGLALSLLYFLVVIPSLGGGGTPYLVRFFPLGTEMSSEGILSVMRQETFWKENIMKFLVYNIRLGLPFLFLFWFHPPALLAMAPQILLNGLNWYENAQFPNLYHYSSPVIPWAFVGSVEGLKRLEKIFLKKRPVFNWEGMLSVALGTSFATTFIMLGYTPLSKGFSWPQMTGRENTLREVLNQIPQDAAVSADAGLGSHLGRREILRFFPDMRDVDWLVLDAWYGYYRLYGQHHETLDLARSILESEDWETVAAEGGVILLKRGSGPPKNLETAFHPRDREKSIFVDIRFGSGDSSIGLENISTHKNIKGLAFVICTDWQVNSNSSFIPGIELSLENGSSYDTQLVSYQLFPSIFQQVGTYRDCTELPALVEGKKYFVKISVTNEDGILYPLSVYTPITNIRGESELRMAPGPDSLTFLIEQ